MVAKVRHISGIPSNCHRTTRKVIFAAAPDGQTPMEHFSSSELNQNSVGVAAPSAVGGPLAKKVPERSVAMAANSSRGTFAFVPIDQCEPVAGKIATVTAPRLNSIFWPQGVTGVAYVRCLLCDALTLP